MEKIIVLSKEQENEPSYDLKIVPKNVIGITLIHILGIYGLMVAFKEANYLTICWIFWILFLSGMGAGVGAHRYWAHQSFKANLPLQILLMAIYSMCGINSIYSWCRDHKNHHLFIETDADPHNAKRGFFFSHVGWLMCEKHPDVYIKGSTADLTYLKNDLIVNFQRKYHFQLMFVFWFLFPTIIPLLFWNETVWTCVFVCLFARYFIFLNLLWCVNSVAHLYGMKPYNVTIGAAECKGKTFLMGEGYHNYHHTFPWDYSASEFGSFEILNFGTLFIDFFSSIGWAYKLKRATPQLIEKKKINVGLNYKKPSCELSSQIIKFSTPFVSFLFLKYIYLNFV